MDDQRQALDTVWGETEVHEFAEHVSRLRRALRRRTRVAFDHDALPVAQIELLHAIGRTPDSRVNEIADRLQLNGTTVTNLANQLEQSGLVRRTRSEADGRVVLLALTERGVSALAAWQSTQEQTLGHALAQLPARDQARIRSALPALGRLAEILA